MYKKILPFRKANQGQYNNSKRNNLNQNTEGFLIYSCMRKKERPKDTQKSNRQRKSDIFADHQ